MAQKYTILVGDIGGTNSRLRLFEVDAKDHIPDSQRRFIRVPGKELLNKDFPNENYRSFSDVAHEFLKSANLSENPIAACLAVAGPVDSNEVAFTNRSSWVINGYCLEDDLGIKRVKLVNDFVAAGFGLLTLDETNPAEVVVLQDVPFKDDAPIACIGAGTGLGECFLTANEGGFYTAFASEGGHSEFPPRNDLEVELLTYLKNKFKEKSRVSVERVVSGKGLANVYEFLRQKFPSKVNPEINEKFDRAGDQQGREVAMGAQAGDALCNQTMDIMISAFGAEAGVTGLKFLPFGGLYICGGLAPKNLARMQSATFFDAFHDKGRVSKVLSQIPVKLCKAEDVGTRGAHLVAFRLFQEEVHGPRGTGASTAPASDTLAVVLPSVVALGALIVAALALLKH